MKICPCESEEGAPDRDQHKARGNGQREKHKACPTLRPSPALSQAAEAPPNGPAVALADGPSTGTGGWMGTQQAGALSPRSPATHSHRLNLRLTGRGTNSTDQLGSPGSLVSN